MLSGVCRDWAVLNAQSRLRRVRYDRREIQNRLLRLKLVETESIAKLSMLDEPDPGLDILEEVGIISEVSFSTDLYSDSTGALLHIEFLTSDVSLEGYSAGRYRVHLRVDGNVNVYPHSENPHHDGYYHPHVATSGEACLGNLSPEDGGNSVSGELGKLISTGKVSSAISLLLAWLNSYNSADPYCKISYLFDGYSGDECNNCGEEDCECFTCESCDVCTHPDYQNSCGVCEDCCSSNHNHCDSCGDCHGGSSCSEYNCDPCCEHNHVRCTGCSECITDATALLSANCDEYCQACFENLEEDEDGDES